MIVESLLGDVGDVGDDYGASQNGASKTNNESSQKEGDMKKYFTPEQISDALFHTDPMNTCCKENDCYDEYDYVAQDVAKRLQAGQDLAAALEKEIGHWFYDGGPFNTAVLQPVINELEGASHDR